MFNMMKILVLAVCWAWGAQVQAKAIAVLGDSLSAGYGMEVSQGWVALLQAKLKPTHPDWTVVNESISGDTSAGGLARLQPILQQKPAVLILELGGNDGLRGLSPAMMQANLKTIIQQAQAVGAKVLLLSMRMPPNYGARYTELFYKVYPQLAKELDVVYVPFILDSIALDKSLMQRDGIHPNAVAQPLIVEKIWAYLKGVLQ